MHFKIYKDTTGDWRWNFKAANGRIVADSAEGYRNRSDCLNGISLVQGSSAAPVYE